MNITSVKAGNFANGFSCFCPNCFRFFSVQYLDCEVALACPSDETDYCPHCGGRALITSVDDLLKYCFEFYTDPVNFYHAFPIIGCVISDKQKKLTVTAESLAAQLGYDKEIVVKVFEELHITEGGGAA